MDDYGPDQHRPLRDVPMIDVRDGGPVAHAAARRDQARAVRDACLGWLPAGAALAGIADPLVRGWMERARSPYFGDIGGVALTIVGS